jgi:hypothetical protein
VAWPSLLILSLTSSLSDMTFSVLCTEGPQYWERAWCRGFSPSLWNELAS